ncbi:CBS domain-containing protein [Streptomyces globisporus]|uniref:CBS domain-containing protein n=1 Tax=Streptomyces globisporus TaxID=1908 RepID=UPI0004CB9B23|nr:CBS domain-containing protein [Streptomyces globisporus]
MRHRSVADLMTPTAVSVVPATTFKEIARLLDEFDITAVCVVDESNGPLGVVSEADLVGRRAAGAGLDTAGALMSSPAVVARPEWSVVRAARVMDRAGVKRLPVVDAEGQLVGVLSRSDLVQLFLRRDRAIQEEIVEDVVTHTLGLSPSALSVEVADSRVTLSGAVRRRSLVPVLLRLCDGVDGVVGGVDRLTYEDDDLQKEERS